MRPGHRQLHTASQSISLQILPFTLALAGGGDPLSTTGTEFFAPDAALLDNTSEGHEDSPRFAIECNGTTLNGFSSRIS